VGDFDPRSKIVPARPGQFVSHFQVILLNESQTNHAYGAKRNLFAGTRWRTTGLTARCIGEPDTVVIVT